MAPQQAAAELKGALVEFASKKPVMAKAQVQPAASCGEDAVASVPAVVLPYKLAKKKVQAKATLRVGQQRRAVAAAR
jgi:hypothetical protein